MSKMRVEKNISYTYIPKLVFYTLGNMYRNKIYIIAYYFPHMIMKEKIRPILHFLPLIPIRVAKKLQHAWICQGR